MRELQAEGKLTFIEGDLASGSSATTARCSQITLQAPRQASAP
jgi:hypothetical protein